MLRDVQRVQQHGGHAGTEPVTPPPGQPQCKEGPRSTPSGGGSPETAAIESSQFFNRTFASPVSAGIIFTCCGIGK